MNKEIKIIFSHDMTDEKYIKDVAHTKRFLELYTLDPNFANEFKENEQEVLKKYGLTVDILAVKILTNADMAKKYNADPENTPLAVKRYCHFIVEKYAHRKQLFDNTCVPKQEKFRIWRERQINRCWAELGGKNHSLIHTPLMFELSDGCSVGCEFCGVAAGKLSKVFLYTEENAELWRSILEFCKEVLSAKAAGSGTCYYATEPFDNPHYEKFSDDFYSVLGTVPQITTAVAMKNPQRTKETLKAALQKVMKVHRFSVLSLEIFHQILDFFTPEELICVELLPQFPEAPTCKFASAGRARNYPNKEKISTNKFDATIACISGFVVNMASRTIRLCTPCRTDDEHPTGEQIWAREKFTDLQSLKEKIMKIINEQMINNLDYSKVVGLLPCLETKNTEFGAEIIGFGGYQMNLVGNENVDLTLLANGNISSQHYQELIKLLQVNQYSAREIATILWDKYQLMPVNSFFILNKFYGQGILTNKEGVFDES